MTVQGHIKNGAIVPDVPIVLPEGAQVQIEVVEAKTTSISALADEIPTLYERLKSVVGAAKGLPPDASANVDHYLYGHAKK